MRRRARYETTLENLVAENRFTIAVVFPTIGAAMLLASAFEVIPAPLRFHPALLLFGVAVMRLPLIAGVLPLLDRRGAVGLLALTAYTYAIELVGVRTGIPYGDFRYLIDLGPMLGGEVPIGLPIFFLPLVLNSYLLVLLLFGERTRAGGFRLLTTLAAVLAMDLVLDPGAVGIGFWTYAEGGFYGVPASNFAGWLLSGTVAVVLFDWMLDLDALLERLETVPFMLDDVVSFVILWGGINLALGHWIPAGVATCFGVGLLYTGRFDFSVFHRR